MIAIPRPLTGDDLTNAVDSAKVAAEAVGESDVDEAQLKILLSKLNSHSNQGEFSARAYADAINAGSDDYAVVTKYIAMPAESSRSWVNGGEGLYMGLFDKIDDNNPQKMVVAKTGSGLYMMERFMSQECVMHQMIMQVVLQLY